MMSPKLTGRLPEPARQALKRAAETGEPESLERRSAIDNAIMDARRRYPHFFKPEAVCYV